MRAALGLSALLLTQRIEAALLSNGAIAHLRSEGNLLADALGRLFDAANVPFALRTPAAHAFLEHEAARFEEERGHSAATQAFRNYAHYLMPAGPLFARSLPAGPVTEMTGIHRNRDGTVSIDTTRCAGGQCKRSSRKIGGGAAGLRWPLPPAEQLYKAQGSFGAASDSAGRLMGAMDRPFLPKIVRQIFGGGGSRSTGGLGKGGRRGGQVIAVPLAIGALPAGGANPIDKILGSVVGGILGGNAGAGGGDAFGGPPGAGGKAPGSWSVTKVSNGHAVTETTTCNPNGKCKTERKEFDLPGGGGGGGGGFPMGGLPMNGFPFGLPMGGGGIPMGGGGGTREPPRIVF